ncbi:hypothetical protein D0T49_00225 [Paludibacter sp. 221]|uniref:hypothetical protein n=1 Tax=Paludibacter sp. 221 TaxID=2302939 RepID=UPI0013D85AA0|nr:hypothetical protein [Paludibacter sp. 221]NDV45478.1 hypothetical protein [Paludibacter sp. 221]
MVRKEILVGNGQKLKLKKLFNTSYPTVRTALAFKTNTALAYRIREAALKMGGVVVERSETQKAI